MDVGSIKRTGWVKAWFVGRRILVAAFVVLLLVGNLRLYTPANGPAPVAQTVSHLKFVRAQLDNGLGERMQARFPEGYFFSYVLYGLTWVEVGLRPDVDSGDASRALSEARWALSQLDSIEGRAPFSPSLTPSYGGFYVGWTNYLRAGIVKLQADPDETEIGALRAGCDEIISGLDVALGQDAAGLDPVGEGTVSGDTARLSSGLPFLPSYPGQTWPVDTYPAMVSVQGCAESVDPRYRQDIDAWLLRVDQLTDVELGLDPHRVEPYVEHPRATSQTLILRFLAELDPVRAKERYLRFRDEYLVSRLGVPAIREHPKDVDADGDVDSGPLVVGVSASASVVAVAAAQVNGDDRTAAALRQSGEAFGWPVTLPGGRRYLGGALPLGDLFVVWSSGSQLWYQSEIPSLGGGPSGWWRVPSHAFSLVAGVVMWGVVWPHFRRRLDRWVKRCDPRRTDP